MTCLKVEEIATSRKTVCCVGHLLLTDKLHLTRAVYSLHQYRHAMLAPYIKLTRQSDARCDTRQMSNECQ